MYFPILINWTSPFPVLGLLGGIFLNFIQIFKDTSVSKQWRTWSDAAFYGVWSGFARLPMSHKKDASLDGLNFTDIFEYSRVHLSK